MGFLQQLAQRAESAGRRIILAEGHDERVQDAAVRLQDHGHIEPILLTPDCTVGPPPGWKGPIRCPVDDPELPRYADFYRQIRPQEALDDRTARERVADPLYFAGLMVRAGDADGVVAGADHATGDVVRAAYRCVGTSPGHSYVTGAFYMVVPSFRGTDEPEVLTFADSGVIPNPSPEQLVEIALQAAEMRSVVVGDVPHVAFLSFSTHGSARSPAAEKMRKAFELLKDKRPDLAADGELQADAALIRQVGQRKAPSSPVAGQANVLIFPDLGAGNIAYKLVERLAGATAIGPILHGLALPYNDLSRGADPASIEWVAYVTAVQAGS
ncbi:MAG: phosphate acetyltransferase [Gemmatimonadetes bacterium]|uniref:Phosphate acetyltransferase n=1 Tax=Candidatus Kutchimonas denitrificans TaxID=3056748 RepID=A0AAE5CCW4_9BACT|nr:phosphate acetyltransferase [Gemmatimonadota bacterium]NIR76563.1 phosphate acetyltransferase [Candidatus Kutchimonas denitrificans]NIS01119.1 phosphate acetyltransferase [Gemmatimonadota bacterium]NIT66886.1 phosphate acetyltransferase [Gemmatimonadota bacterium]NIU54659.1 phosphate acetyltransferase [Gemmatimonadota bacterium]